MSLLAVMLVATALPSQALALSCRTPDGRREVGSGGGRFTLVMDFSEDTGAATLSLFRTDEPAQALWVHSPRDRDQWSAVVSDDGAAVATIAGCGDRYVQLRGRAGEVVRQIPERELASIWERLHGGELRFRGFDAQQGELLVEIGFDAAQSGLENRTNRIRVSDGAVLDPAVEPAEFGLPAIRCGAPNAAFRDLSPWGLVVVGCGRAGEPSGGPMGIYSWDGTRLQPYVVGHWRDGAEDGPWWSAEPMEGTHGSEPGPCETLFRAGEAVSARCGPDVAQFREEDWPTTSSP